MQILGTDGRTTNTIRTSWIVIILKCHTGFNYYEYDMPKFGTPS